jgi:hypothetical protein
MSLLTETIARQRARRRIQAEGVTAEYSLSQIASIQRPRYDIFLSQTIRDAEIVLGVYDMLTELGYTVFCDWIEAPDPDRSRVTPANAAWVKRKMSVSETMLFLDTQGAEQSRWMCWELGWFDGENGHVAVLPVVPDNITYYTGREFLALYPIVEIDVDGDIKIVRPPAMDGRGTTVFSTPNSQTFRRWQQGSPEFARPKAVGESPW